MGLQPTHRDESPFLATIDSKRVKRDFRGSVIIGDRPHSYTTPRGAKCALDEGVLKPERGDSNWKGSSILRSDIWVWV
jgi:hypothetical protein